MKQDPTLSEMLKEWDELAASIPPVDLAASIHEAARMRQRNVERRIALARRIAATVPDTADKKGDADG